MKCQRLIICGASARAAAFSAIRAGWDPWCVDLFADRDLAAVCDARRIRSQEYPQGLPSLIAGEGPQCPWMYTGALENHGRVVSLLESCRPLWGNSEFVLNKVRDPFYLAHELLEAGFCTPPVLPPAATPPDRAWLTKSRRGAGGSRVFWADAFPRRIGRKAEWYHQKWQAGQPHSAIFLTDSSKRAILFGVTQQLVGETWLHARPFAYCGSIGPVHLGTEATRELERLGSFLVCQMGLSGIFGVDFIFSEGRPWIIEVNPRYPASVEILEYGYQRAAFPRPDQLQLREDDLARVETVGCSSDGQQRVGIVGKAILFAATTVRFPDSGPWEERMFDRRNPSVFPAFADVPWPGERIAAGRPVMTVFASGISLEHCRRNLEGTAANLDRLLIGG